MARNVLKNYQELDKSDFRVALSLVQVLNFLEIVDITKSQREDIINNLGQFVTKMSQEQVLSLLGILIIREIPVTQEFMKQVLSNKKLVRLNLVDFYILVRSFRVGDLEIYQHMPQIYLNFWQSQQHTKILPDLKSVLMMAKIQEEANKSVISSHEFGLDRKVAKLVHLIQESLSKLDLTGKMKELIYVSNVFNSVLAKPVFLLTQIYLHRQEILVDQSNADIYVEFLRIMSGRLNPKYFYLSQKKCPLKSSELAIINITVAQIINLNHYQLNMAVVQLFSTPGIKCEKLVYDNYLGWFQKCLSDGCGINYLTLIVSFVKSQATEIGSEENVILFRALDSFLDLEYQLAPSLKFLYAFLGQSQARIDLRATSLERIRKFIKQKVMPKIMNNSKYTVEKITMDQYDIVQLQSHYISEFDGYQYLLPVLKLLGVKLTATQQQNIEKQLTRVCKQWDGIILLENLHCIAEYEMDVFDKVHIPCAENLTTFLVFNPDSGRLFFLRFDESVIFSVLQYYLKAYRLYQKRETKPIETFSLRILTYFANVCFKQLSFTDILSIFEMVGSQQQNYYPQFCMKVKDMQINNSSEIIRAAQVLPSWLVHKKLRLSLEQTLQQTDHLNFKVLQTQRIFHPEYLSEAMLKITDQNLQQLMEYISYNGNPRHPDTRKFIEYVWSIRDRPEITQNEECFSTLMFMKMLDVQVSTNEREVGQKVSFKVKLNKESSQQETEMVEFLKQLSLFLPQRSLQAPDGEIVEYYKCFVSQQKHLIEPQWKVYPSFANSNLKECEKLNDFIKEGTYIVENPTNKQDLMVLGQHILGTTENVLGEVNVEETIRRRKHKISEQYTQLMISLTLELPKQTNDMAILSSANRYCEKTNSIVDLSIVVNKSGDLKQTAIIFADIDDIITQFSDSNAMIKDRHLSPQMLIKASLLSLYWDKVVVLDMHKWQTHYQSREDHANFMKKLLF